MLLLRMHSMRTGRRNFLEHSLSLKLCVQWTVQKWSLVEAVCAFQISRVRPLDVMCVMHQLLSSVL